MQQQENIYKTRCDPEISEIQRREYIYGEFELVGSAIETKAIETGNKAAIFRFFNVLSSLGIITLSAVMIGLEAASDCMNIPVIVLSSLIFLTETSHKLFGWGTQGITYKQNTIRLKRVNRQIRNVMLQFHTFSTEWLLAIIGQFWTEYDDIEVGLYKLTTPDAAKYNTGLSFESGVPQEQTQQQQLPSSNRLSPFPNISNHNHTNTKDHSPHIHIHIDKTPSHDNLIVPASEPRKLLTQEKINYNKPVSSLPQIEIEDDEEILNTDNLNTNMADTNITDTSIAAPNITDTRMADTN